MPAEVVPMWKNRLPEALNPLRRIKRWVVWRTEINDQGKETKPPFQSLRPTRTASSTREETWSSYQDAVANAPRRGGVGFVLGGDFGGLDLDNCRDPDTEEVEDWAEDILERVGDKCYVEVSPSGKGFHIIGECDKGPLPDGAKIVHFKQGHVELYRKSPRYFTVTGEQYNKCTRIQSCDDIIDYVSALKKKSSITSAVMESDKTRSAQQIWAQARHLMKAGKSDEQIFKQLAGKFGDYKGEDWLKTDIERMRKKFEESKKKVSDVDSSWRIVTSKAFLNGFVPPDYLIEGILQRRFIYALTGKTGSGKSAVTLRLSAMIGQKIGAPKLGDHVIERGRVIYFAGENPDDIRIRWVAMLDQMGLEDSELNVHFMVGRTNLMEDMEAIRDAAIEIKPDLIIVDTARAYFPGDDENDNVQMGAYARLLRQLTDTGACVVVNCHPTKNAANDNLQPVGGGAFVAEVDGNLTCTHEDDVVRIHWQTKLRGPEFAPILFELREVEGPMRDTKRRKIKSVIASPMNEQKAENRSLRNRTDLTAVLSIMLMNAEGGLSMNAIAERLTWKLADGRPNKMKVQRIVHGLAKKKLAHQPHGFPHYILTNSGKILARRHRRMLQRDNAPARPSARRS